MKMLLFVCFGGALGSGARYLLAGWLQAASDALFPWGTFAVNALGSFLLAALLTATTGNEVISDELRLGLSTGLLGGFTTYSTFNYETLRLFEGGHARVGVAYVVATLLVCLACGALGFGVARHFTTA